MKDYSTCRCADFATDQLFINWVRNPDPDSDSFWAAFIASNPELKKELEDARMIVQSMQFEEKELPEDEVRELWHTIHKDAKKNGAMVYFWRAAVACAASVAIIFGLWKWMGQGVEKSFDPLIEFIANHTTPETTQNDVQIVLYDNSNYSVANNNPEIKYEEGNLTVDSREVVRQSAPTASSEVAQFNQVIVPWGKRAHISFSDGSKLWLNAGSRAVYPVVFTGNKREVFIEGEAYFEVAHDELKPFIVKTGKIDVKVLGTSFNVNAYPQENKTEVALVDGSVQVIGRNQQVTQLQPDHVVEIDNTTDQQVIRHVDVYDYICWKEGFLQFRSENPEIILRRIERHYAIPVIVQTQLGGYTISGKLDLKENMTGTLDIIEKLIPVQYYIENNQVFIQKK